MKLRSMLLATAFVAAWPGIASAKPINGPYINFGMGLNVLEGEDYTVGGVTTNYYFDDGYAVMGAFGWGFDNGFRGEVEVNYSFNGVGDPRTTPQSGNVISYGLFANGIYDFDNPGAVHPYVGLGLGGMYVEADAINGAITGDDIVLAAQAIVGLNINVADNIDVFGDYRYIHASKPTFGVVEGTYYANRVLVGMRYTFGESEDCNCDDVPSEYMVFFPLGSHNLTNSAEETVAMAAENARQSNPTRISLTGHTDTSGGSDYNMRLSERRANTVRAELESQGVDPDDIVVRWKGETDTLVATGDGVPEARNRRVEIIFD